MNDKIGILAFAFGYRSNGNPGISNWALAREVERLQIIYPGAMTVVQHEIASCLASAMKNDVISIEKHRREGEYLDSEEVILQAAQHFYSNDIKKVLVVAQPFLHRFKCVKLVRLWKFEPIVPQTRWIPFDEESEQWWTRGPLKLLAYAVLQKLTGRRGK